MLGEYLAQEGFRVRAAHDGESGVHAALSQQYALIVLDMMLPRLHGIEVLRRLRTQTQVPILILTARNDDIDCVMGLEFGADDYVAKPCAPRTLLARIKALLRRTQPVHTETASTPLRVGPMLMWPTKRHVEWDGQRLTLTATEFSLLEVLVRHAGTVVHKRELSRQALGRPLERFDRSIDVHVSSIRQKLPLRDDAESWIQTVRGVGYLLITE
jgi:DNA-binding response OmpR family regulator